MCLAFFNEIFWHHQGIGINMLMTTCCTLFMRFDSMDPRLKIKDDKVIVVSIIKSTPKCSML